MTDQQWCPMSSAINTR